MEIPVHIKHLKLINSNGTWKYGNPSPHKTCQST